MTTIGKALWAEDAAAMRLEIHKAEVSMIRAHQYIKRPTDLSVERLTLRRRWMFPQTLSSTFRSDVRLLPRRI